MYLQCHWSGSDICSGFRAVDQAGYLLAFGHTLVDNIISYIVTGCAVAPALC